MELEDSAAIHVEAIEVILNHILYVRGVYPAQVFKKRRVYNTPVFIIAFPGLNSYLGNVLKTVQHLLQQSAQQHLQLEVIVYATESAHLERYLLEIQPVFDKQQQTQDQYLIEYEQQLSAALYKMAERVKQLPKLGNNAKFKVQIHTTQTAFTQLSHEAQYQEFPWLQATESPQQQLESRKISLLPLATVDKLGLKMEAHISS
ncbi:DNA polymerase zeta processivity subunit [Drosophila grimshawi]|uniref:GH14659 n=1 Tax=Drosophila grimshawi TaxID=7222 RepID=B4JV04_DROGR|nr:DNA polymerase zeta processivity subunit [Drosophila grimshawi]EDV91324.1 GH14659 [Drosophila grimshawi]